MSDVDVKGIKEEYDAACRAMLADDPDEGTIRRSIAARHIPVLLAALAERDERIKRLEGAVDWACANVENNWFARDVDTFKAELRRREGGK